MHRENLHKGPSGHLCNKALVNSVMAEIKKIYESHNSKKKLVFASKTAFGRVDIKKAWQSALKKSGIENFVFHGLRHHYCSMGGQMGASSVQLRAQLGHSSLQMTDHYSHIEADSTRYIGERIEQKIF